MGTILVEHKFKTVPIFQIIIWPLQETKGILRFSEDNTVLHTLEHRPCLRTSVLKQPALKY